MESKDIIWFVRLMDRLSITWAVAHPQTTLHPALPSPPSAATHNAIYRVHCEDKKKGVGALLVGSSH